MAKPLSGPLKPEPIRDGDSDVNPAYPGVSGWEAEIPPIDGVGSAVVFEAAFNGERGVGIGLQPAAFRPTRKWDAPLAVIAFERFLLQNLF